MLVTLFRSRKAIIETFNRMTDAPKQVMLTNAEWNEVYLLLKLLDPLVKIPFDLQRHDYTLGDATVDILHIMKGLKTNIETEDEGKQYTA